MSRIMHFEVHAENPARAIAFYTELLGWNFSKWGDFDYWLITTGPDSEPGINGGLVTRKGPGGGPDTPVIAYTCTAGVEDLDSKMAQAVALGGTVAHPKMPIPTIGWLGYVKDTEGNIFGMMQTDPTAA